MELLKCRSRHLLTKKIIHNVIMSLVQIRFIVHLLKNIILPKKIERQMTIPPLFIFVLQKAKNPTLETNYVNSSSSKRNNRRNFIIKDDAHFGVSSIISGVGDNIEFNVGDVFGADMTTIA